MSDGCEVVSLNIGRAKKLTVEGSRPFRSAIGKLPVEGKVYLGLTGLDGDQVGDSLIHGGPDKALCVYSARHFPYWENELGRTVNPGLFGENLTLSNIQEEDVWIGDVFQIGEVKVQCSQPRQPCHKLNKVFGRKDMACMVKTRGATGFYLRVITPGWIQPGESVQRVSRNKEACSVVAINNLLTRGRKDQEVLKRVLALDTLAEACKRDLKKKLT